VIMSVVSVYYYVRVLIPVWSSATKVEPLRASFSTRLAILVSGVLSIGLGIYPTTALLAGQIGATSIPGQ
jgi:NADH:ubiquinone oxidoreductase subunit 2 (subunit N)